MKLLQNLKQAWQIATKGSIADFLRGEDGDRSGAVMTNAYTQSTWVYSCISLIAAKVAQTPFVLVRGNGKTESEVTSGPVYEAFHRPHPQMSRFEFWENYITWMLVRGEVFIVPMLDGRMIRLVPVNPERMWPIMEGNLLAGWRYSAGPYSGPVDSEVFLPEEVIHDKLVNPWNFYRGLSPMEVAQLPASGDYAAAQFMKGFMMNNADSGLIVTTDQQVTPEQREQLMSALRERKRRAGTADRPLILFGGLKVEKPALNSADSKYLEQRKCNRQEICAIFGVPQELLGINEDANRSVGESTRLNFVENRIAPFCQRIAAAWELQIAAWDKTLKGYFDIDDLPEMQAARRSRIASGTALFAMGVPLNTINEDLDLGLPDIDHGDVGYLPTGLLPVGTVRKPTQVDTGKPTDATTNSFNKALRILDTIKEAEVVAAKETHVCKAAAEYEAAIQPSILAKRSKIERLFFEQRGRVLEALQARYKAGIPTAQRANDDLFDVAAENNAVHRYLDPLLVMDLQFGGAQLSLEIGEPNFALAPEDALAYLSKRQSMISGINETTAAAIDATMMEGLTSGESLAQLSDRIKNVFTEATDRRADTIAVTETNTAINSGRFGAMQKAKVPMKTWHSSNLEGVRVSHSQANLNYGEKGIPLDQPFRVGGFDLMHPGDPDGPAKEVINCRCYTRAVLPDRSTSGVLLTYNEFRATAGRSQMAYSELHHP